MAVLLYTILVLAVGLILTRWYLKQTRWPHCFKCLVGKTCIVTGANTGIGYFTALDFAMRGGRVILACRDEARAEQARKRIVEATGNENVVVRLVNFASLQSVRSFCEEFNATEERLDILVNNAGAVGLGNKKTVDGIQMIMQINYFAAFLLTHLLIGKMKKCPGARIVNVSSVLSHYGELDLEKINDYPVAKTVSNAELRIYYTSKQCEVLFTRELAHRLQGTGVIANALHPGSVMTDIWRNVPQSYRAFVVAIVKFLFKTPHEGAQTSIYCALSDEVENMSGMWFENAQLTRLYPKHLDSALGKKLWTLSEDFVKLQNHEKISETH